MRATWVEHTDAALLAVAVAARLDAALDDALSLRGRAVLALAGGRTSPPVFRRMAARARDWSAVTLLPSDERWVPRNHPDCNLTQMQDGFSAASGMHWVALVPPLAAGEPDATFANAALAACDGEFDATLLGMGADGHFASLFPGAASLARGLAPGTSEAAIAVLPDPLPTAGPHPRISLTLRRLLHSRRVLLAVTGDDKRRVIERAQRGADPAELPIAALLSAPQSALEIHWSP